MLKRIAIVVLALATPVAAQEEQRARVSELEAGAGWYQWNPFGVSDFIVFPSAPSATISRMVWRTARHGYATGISAVLGKVDPREGNQVRERAFPIYAHVSYRWRWFLKDPENSIHFGVGIGPGVFRRTDLVRAWGTKRGTWHYPGETKTRWRLAVRYHTELFFTTRLQENVDLRTGIRWLPLLYLPLAAEPMVMGVWRF